MRSDVDRLRRAVDRLRKDADRLGGVVIDCEELLIGSGRGLIDFRRRLIEGAVILAEIVGMVIEPLKFCHDG